MVKTRRIVQFGCLALVLVGVFVFQANCERWCPFGGVEALYTYAAEGDMLCSLGVANFFILGGVLVMTLLARRAFCGYMCPIGTISDWLGALGRRLHVRPVTVPRPVDRLLSPLKYVLLVVILFFTWRAGELIFRGFDPCFALIGRHGEDITAWAYVTSGVIVVASLAITLPFCRWFCPLAAVLNPFSRIGLARIKRDTHSCCDCGICSRRCPMDIPVAELQQVTSARCISCLNCVDACPKNDRGQNTLAWGIPGHAGFQWPQVVLVATLLVCTTSAVMASYLFPIPSFVRSHGVRPEQVSRVEFRVADLTCRGRANLLMYFLERDDMHQISGYYRLEAWPGPGLADVRVTFDPNEADNQAIYRAVTEPYYDATADYWRDSPFEIEGYDPLGLDLGDGESDNLP